MQPNQQDYDFNLDTAYAAMVEVRAHIPEDAFTAEVLGTERAGHGALIRSDGLVLTVGYLVAEAETIWLTLSDGRAVPGHVIAYDYETGFGLVQALARLDLPVFELGDSDTVRSGDRVVVAGAGGPNAAVAAIIDGRSEFAGYWEYLIDDALFTKPAHPNWGGCALIGDEGKLLGIGSLLVQRGTSEDDTEDQNMCMPVNLLKPVFDDLMTTGRPGHPPRPWLGLYAADVANNIVVAGLSSHGPAADADLQVGDIILSVAGAKVTTLPEFFRHTWALGAARVVVPLQIFRDGQVLEVEVQSADRHDFLKSPVAH